jgi:mono/diheme cytochrome c family protein
MVMARGQFADVGCEACHGPAALHVRSVDGEKKNNVIIKPDPATCLGCHTPDWNIGGFDPALAMKEVVGPGHGMPAAPKKAR